VSAIPPTLAYRTPPPLRTARLPWKIAIVAWSHVAMGGAMVLLARPHLHKLQSDVFRTWLTAWLATMILAPVIAGGAVLLGQRRFLARLVAAICVVPLVLAELLVAVYGILMVGLAHFAYDSNEGGTLLTIGIASLAIATLLVGLTNALIRYLSKPCDRPPNAILPT
jgi:hypothetical protein